MFVSGPSNDKIVDKIEDSIRDKDINAMQHYFSILEKRGYPDGEPNYYPWKDDTLGDFTH